MQHITNCPDPRCGAPAEIVDRWVWTSTDGPVEHVATWCANGHRFTPTLDFLTTQPTRSPSPEPALSATVD
jgi:hypothetical protein